MAYGARLLVADAADLGLAAILARRFPPDFVRRPGGEAAPVRYEISRAASGYRIARNGQLVDRGQSAADLIERLCSHLDVDLAALARGGAFIHAGVVGWRGVAILIPALSGCGKSTLVAELVRRGAQYYSDDYAVLDDGGKVHPFARPIAFRRGAPRRLDIPAVPSSELPPLDVGLVVATTYRAGSVWEPAILQGARAVLPILDNAVGIRRHPARIMRLAAALGTRVVTLESPRPEAEAVAPEILEFADHLRAGELAHFTSVRRPGRARATARIAEVGRKPPAEGTVLRAAYLRIENFLEEDEHRMLLEYARAREEDFRESTVYNPDETRGADPHYRRSQTLHRLDEGLWEIFEKRLRALLPHVHRQLGIPCFRLGAIERQLHAHRSGDFFGRHLDNGHGDVVWRRISAVYYFHEMPRCFDGGALCLYDEVDCGDRRCVAPSCTALEPLDNSIVFFPSSVTHEVEPVRYRRDDFGSSRFTITFWFREEAKA